MTNASKKPFIHRVSGLVKEFGDAKIRYEDARSQLEHIFGREWVGRLEYVLDGDRATCGRCDQEFDEMLMADDDVCLGCARDERIFSE